MDDVAQRALSELLAFKEGIGEMRANITNMAHDIKGLVQSMQNFVPRREIEQMQTASMERAQTLHARIDTVEKTSAERSDTQDRITNDRIGRIERSQEYLLHKLIGVGLAAAAGGGTLGAAASKMLAGH